MEPGTKEPPRTPRGIKIAVAVAVAGVAGWLLHDYLDRRGNERRMSEVASAIAGREVRVECPGPLKRLFSYELYDGSVRFDADGRPADKTRLTHGPCEELDALGEGDRDGTLRCIAADAGGCAGADELSRAVNLLAHESWHLAGRIEEAETECRALQTLASAAERLGATAAEGTALARRQLEHSYPLVHPRYRSAECVDGGRLDVNPETAAWP